MFLFSLFLSIGIWEVQTNNNWQEVIHLKSRRNNNLLPSVDNISPAVRYPTSQQMIRQEILQKNH